MIPKFEIVYRIWIVVLLGSILLARMTGASMTDPTLFLSRGVDYATMSAQRLIRIEGSFPWEALVQSGYPIQVVIWNRATETEFVRFDLHGNATAGSSPTVADGLTPNEATALLSIGQSSPQHRLIYVGPGRIEARLGPTFGQAPLAAQIFVVDNGTTFVSNPINFTAATP